MTDDVDVSDARLQFAVADKVKAAERALNDAMREAFRMGMECRINTTMLGTTVGMLETVNVSVFRRLA